MVLLLMAPAVAVRAFVSHHDFVIPIDALQSFIVKNIYDADVRFRFGAADRVVLGPERIWTCRTQVILRTANDLQLAFVLVIKLQRRQNAYDAQVFDVLRRQGSSGLVIGRALRREQ